MAILLTIVHVIVCFFMIIVVLLQSGQAADLAGAFGGMGSQTAFGPRGSATIMTKATTIAAAVFMITSMTLAILATRGATTTGSVLEKQKAPVSTAPATPKGPSSVTITPEGGPSKTIPLPRVTPQTIPPPAQQQQQPSPAKK